MKCARKKPENFLHDFNKFARMVITARPHCSQCGRAVIARG